MARAGFSAVVVWQQTMFPPIYEGVKGSTPWPAEIKCTGKVQAWWAAALSAALRHACPAELPKGGENPHLAVACRVQMTEARSAESRRAPLSPVPAPAPPLSVRPAPLSLAPQRASASSD